MRSRTKRSIQPRAVTRTENAHRGNYNLPKVIFVAAGKNNTVERKPPSMSPLLGFRDISSFWFFFFVEKKREEFVTYPHTVEVKQYRSR